jgi:hypothetical protein
MSSIPPPAGGLSAAIVVVARRWKEYHVVAAVEGHELKTPETEHRPGPERLLETIEVQTGGTARSDPGPIKPGPIKPGPTKPDYLSVPCRAAQRAQPSARARHGQGTIMPGRPDKHDPFAQPG